MRRQTTKQPKIPAIIAIPTAAQAAIHINSKYMGAPTLATVRRDGDGDGRDCDRGRGDDHDHGDITPWCHASHAQTTRDILGLLTRHQARLGNKYDHSNK